MANPFQQKARQRKIAYFVAILVLFTAALVHRQRVIVPMANELQLRESARGEVELTSSAVSLMMLGSRGFATTFLWNAAIDKQMKHEWNEVELLVASITKLQPNFVTPWLFQSWNLAFNVSVECDRPKDKYYYVTRGIDLLGEGERRNKGNEIVPGHPEIRQTMGVYYLRKIGLSDEKTTMRCLLDLSCIDPLKRNPKWFKTSDPQQRREIINTKELAQFCQDNPRLIRRLREGLNYTTEREILDFLEKNKDVPSRFETVEWSRLPAKIPEQRQTPLKEAIHQFPIVPPNPNGDPTRPRPDQPNFTNESADVFLMARAWVDFSQEPLPPPSPDEAQIKEIVRQRKQYRLPKSMALILFRGYPARCQEYIAEGLEEEGWFDEDGWLVRGWFDTEPGLGDGEFFVGKEAKYHAQPAWDKTAIAYEKYGRENDMLFSPQAEADLNAEAAAFREAYKVNPGDVRELRADDRASLQKSWLAHHRLIWSVQNRGMSNFDDHYWAAQAERTRDCIMARKLFHKADILRKIDLAPEQALECFDQAWPFFINVLLENPKFAGQSLVQEDAYEDLLRSIKLTQNQRSGMMKPAFQAVAQLGIWPHVPIDPLLSPTDRQRIFPVRNAHGILEWLQVPKLPEQDLARTRQFLAVWPSAGTGFAGVLQPPAVWNMMLVRNRFHEEAPPAGWTRLLDDNIVVGVRDRLGLPTK
jgi:hypothetical protein